MKAIDYQPQLGWWSHVWRYALMLAISGLAWFDVAIWQWNNNRMWFWADFALGLLGLVLVAWRRAFHVQIALIANALSFVSWASAGPATLALVSMATRRRWREIIPVGILSLTSGLVLEAYNPVNDDRFAFTIPFIVAIIAVTVGWGMYIGSRR